MIITCPRCQARAKLPDSKEGSKALKARTQRIESLLDAALA